MHLKSSNGAPINVLVLNQDEDVATMVPVPKYSRTGRQHTHVGQQDPTQEMADLEKDLQQEGNMDVRTDDLDRVKRTDETESPMEVDESPSEGPDRRGAGVSQRSLEAIVEKLHKDNEEKSNGHEDELESGKGSCDFWSNGKRMRETLLYIKPYYSLCTLCSPVSVLFVP